MTRRCATGTRRRGNERTTRAEAGGRDREQRPSDDALKRRLLVPHFWRPRWPSPSRVRWTEAGWAASPDGTARVSKHPSSRHLAVHLCGVVHKAVEMFNHHPTAAMFMPMPPRPTHARLNIGDTIPCAEVCAKGKWKANRWVGPPGSSQGEVSEMVRPPSADRVRRQKTAETIEIQTEGAQNRFVFAERAVVRSARAGTGRRGDTRGRSNAHEFSRRRKQGQKGGGENEGGGGRGGLGGGVRKRRSLPASRRRRGDIVDDVMVGASSRSIYRLWERTTSGCKKYVVKKIFSDEGVGAPESDRLSRSGRTSRASLPRGGSAVRYADARVAVPRVEPNAEEDDSASSSPPRRRLRRRPPPPSRRPRGDDSPSRPLRLLRFRRSRSSSPGDAVPILREHLPVCRSHRRDAVVPAAHHQRRRASLAVVPAAAEKKNSSSLSAGPREDAGEAAERVVAVSAHRLRRLPGHRVDQTHAVVQGRDEDVPVVRAPARVPHGGARTPVDRRRRRCQSSSRSPPFAFAAG